MPDRFWVKVDKNGPVPARRPELGPCWIWTAAKAQGYGRFALDGKVWVAPRLAYELLVGPIPPELTLDHLCRNPPCVNPSHLEPVTLWENTLRGESPFAQAANRTHCPSGHPYDEANTVYRTKRNGRQMRRCRTCLEAQQSSPRHAAMNATRNRAIKALIAAHQDEFEALLRDLRSA